MKTTIPITLRTVYNALERIFPRDARIFYSCITELLKIEKSDKLAGILQTLGINDKGQLFINEEFWEKFLNTEENVSIILLHELIHRVTNDTRFLVYIDKDDPERDLKAYAANIAQDARINAFIYRYCPGLKVADLFKSIYTKEFLEQTPLLGLLVPHGKEYIPEKIMLEIYNNLYTGEVELYSFYTLYTEVLEYLRKNNQGQTGTVLFIGNHGELTDENGNSVDIPEELKETIKDFIREQVSDKDKPGGKRPGVGQTLGESILNEAIGIDQKLNINCFRRLAFDNIMTNVRLTMMDISKEKTKSLFIPSILSRPDLFKLIYGYVPLVWDAPAYRLVRNKKKMPIYLDVSGSMWHDLPVIIQMILNIRDDIDFVWGFSNKIAKHTMEDLRNQKIQSTGGTDFDCIIEHAVKNNYGSILVITDGFAYCKQSVGDKVPEIKDVTTVLCTSSRSEDNYFCKTYETTINIEDVTV